MGVQGGGTATLGIYQMRKRIIEIVGIVALLAGCEVPGNNRDLRIASNANEAELALANGANIEASDPFGTTPLMYAARNGRADVAALLVARGANVNAKNSPGDSALSWATKYGHPDIAALLISHGATTTSAPAPAPAPATIAPPVGSVSIPTPAPTKQGGCLDQELKTCLANLQVTFHILPDEKIQDQMARNDAVDINGKRIRDKYSLSIGGYLGESRDIGLVTLEYTADKIVNHAKISLWRDPSRSQTASEFDSTGLYEGVLSILGSECKSVNRNDVYSFFYNTVRAKIVKEGRTVEIHDTNAETTYFQKALDIPFCGYRFSYTHLAGYYTENITLNNPHGAGSHTTISFKSNGVPASVR